MTKEVDESTDSAYILSGKLYNPTLKKHEVRYLDSYDETNAIGRFINDAYDTYDADSEKIPKVFRTCFTTNVGYRTVINPDPHPLFGYYMEIFALRDIPRHSELFARHGEGYWDHSNNETPVSKPVKCTEERFHFRMGRYSNRIKELVREKKF